MCGYINETELIDQLQKLVNQIDVNKTVVDKKVVSEVMRYKKFTKSLLGEQSDVAVDNIDTKHT